MLIIIK